jgi:hypothetical protein
MSPDKELARQIQERLKNLGHEIPLGHCYEILAQLQGFSSWNEAKPKASEFNQPDPQFTPSLNKEGEYQVRYHTSNGTPRQFKEETTVTFNVNITGSGHTLAEAAQEAARNFLEEVEGYGDDCRTLEHNIYDIQDPIEHVPLVKQYETGIKKLLKEAEFLSKISGGTVSSAQLRNALIGRKMIKKELPEGKEKEALLEQVETLISLWRSSLKRHNAQPEKFGEYDVETGNPLNAQR